MDITVGNKVLIDFLRNLANSIENNDIDDEHLKTAGEIYMKHKFNQNSDHEESKIAKYISLGWYIYEIVLKNKN